MWKKNLLRSYHDMDKLFNFGIWRVGVLERKCIDQQRRRIGSDAAVSHLQRAPENRFVHADQGLVNTALLLVRVKAVEHVSDDAGHPAREPAPSMDSVVHQVLHTGLER